MTQAGLGWHAVRVSGSLPTSTYVLVIGIIATLSSFGIVVIFLPPWYWYMITVALAIPEIVILAERWIRRQRIKAEMRATLEQLG